VLDVHTPRQAAAAPAAPATNPWSPQHLSNQQQRERAAFERAMRDERLRGLPSAFGDLEVTP
jgi:hypothetical protein